MALSGIQHGRVLRISGCGDFAVWEIFWGRRRACSIVCFVSSSSTMMAVGGAVVDE